MQGHEALAELLQGTELATDASLSATAANADMCNVCKTMFGTSQTLRQAVRHAMPANYAKSHQGAVPRRRLIQLNKTGRGAVCKPQLWLPNSSPCWQNPKGHSAT